MFIDWVDRIGQCGTLCSERGEILSDSISFDNVKINGGFVHYFVHSVPLCSLVNERREVKRGGTSRD